MMGEIAVESRRDFLKKIPERGFCLSQLPGLLRASLLGAVLPPQPANEAVGPSSTVSKEALEKPELSPRNQRLVEYIQSRYDKQVFLYPTSGLVPQPDSLEWDTDSTKNLLEYGAYSKPRFLEIGKATKEYSSKRNGQIENLGIKVNFANLLDLLQQRYAQILSDGLVPSLTNTIDPSLDDFEKLTKKYADLTGFPQDVIKSIWWRENFGIGNAPGLHGGVRAPSGDGALAPFVHLYNMPVNPQGACRYSAQTETFDRIFRPPTEPIKTLAFMGDNRSFGRSNEDIIITPIITDLVQYDTELNIITGLILYYQALEAVFKDSLIGEAVSDARVRNPELEIYDIAYSVYHHGPAPTQVRIKELKKAELGYAHPSWKEYFISPADAYHTSRKYQSWTQDRYIFKSRMPDDPSDLEFFDFLSSYERWLELLKSKPEFASTYRDFMGMVYRTVGKLDSVQYELLRSVGTLGMLLLVSEADVINFLENEFNQKQAPADENKLYREFIQFARNINSLLQDSDLPFGTFDQVGDVHDEHERQRLADNSPMYNRLGVEFNYYLREKQVFPRMSEMFGEIIWSICAVDQDGNTPTELDFPNLASYVLEWQSPEEYQQTCESLRVALQSEKAPICQDDYYQEFAEKNSAFNQRYLEYRHMRESYEARFGSYLTIAMFISIVASDERAVQFSLESIRRLFQDEELVDVVEKVLKEYKKISDLDNKFYFQLKPEDAIEEFAKQMKNNPLYADLLSAWMRGTSGKEGMGEVSRLLYGYVFPGSYGEFDIVNDLENTRNSVKSQIKRDDPIAIVREIMELTEERENR